MKRRNGCRERWGWKGTFCGIGVCWMHFCSFLTRASPGLIIAALKHGISAREIILIMAIGCSELAGRSGRTELRCAAHSSAVLNLVLFTRSAWSSWLTCWAFELRSPLMDIIDGVLHCGGTEIAELLSIMNSEEQP